MELIIRVSENYMQEMGIKIGDRLRLLEGIEEYKKRMKETESNAKSPLVKFT
jgi:hypothetical protein